MPTASIISFRYEFCRIGAEADPIVIDVVLDRQSVCQIRQKPESPPRWTRLDTDRCEGCQLDQKEHSHCPAALSLVDLVTQFDDMLSYSKVTVTVDTEERQYRTETSAQKALSSLVGLYMATSGCPALLPFKAMARFHLPFASREETIYRAAGSHLLGQYFKRQRGEEAELNLDGLREIYDTIHHINMALAKRLRDVSRSDANLNALVLLDLFAQDLPLSIDSNLNEIEHLFRANTDSASAS
jgi:hypothetical protein